MLSQKAYLQNKENYFEIFLVLFESFKSPLFRTVFKMCFSLIPTSKIQIIEVDKNKEKHKNFQTIFWIFAKLPCATCGGFPRSHHVYTLKDMIDTIKTRWTTNFLISVLWFILVLYLVQPKIKFNLSHWTKAVTAENLTLLLMIKKEKKKNLEKTACRIGLRFVTSFETFFCLRWW